MHQKLIGVDLDATLAHYAGWTGIHSIGAPLEWAAPFCQALKDMGCTVSIFTTRCKGDVGGRPSEVSTTELSGIVQRWLLDAGIPFDEVYTGQGKPPYLAIVDDRAVPVPPNPDRAVMGEVLRQVQHLIERKL